MKQYQAWGIQEPRGTLQFGVFWTRREAIHNLTGGKKDHWEIRRKKGFQAVKVSVTVINATGKR